MGLASAMSPTPAFLTAMKWIRKADRFGVLQIESHAPFLAPQELPGGERVRPAVLGLRERP